MPNRSRRRAGAARLDGRRRAAFLAVRLGTAVRGARSAAGLRQVDVAQRAGIAQSFVSRMEHGGGQRASLETWASVAAATGHQLAAFLERVPGTSLPRDYEHLKRQQLIVETARAGGWRAMVEQAIDPDWDRSRSVDVLLRRDALSEVAVVEIWNLLDDVGGAFRGLDGKVGRLSRQETGRVAGLMIVRGTRRNRRLIHEFRALFRARLPAPSRAWLAALADPRQPMPATAGLLWTDLEGSRLMVARL